MASEGVQHETLDASSFDAFLAAQTRNPRLSVVITDDSQRGYHNYEFENEDGTKEYYQIDMNASDNAIAPDSIAGMRLFPEDDVSMLTSDARSLPSAPLPPLPHHASVSSPSNRPSIYPAIDIKSLINIIDEDEECPPPPPPRTSVGANPPMTPTSQSIANAFTRMSLSMPLPALPESNNARTSNTPSPSALDQKPIPKSQARPPALPLSNHSPASATSTPTSIGRPSAVPPPFTPPPSAPSSGRQSVFTGGAPPAIPPRVSVMQRSAPPPPPPPVNAAAPPPPLPVAPGAPVAPIPPHDPLPRGTLGSRPPTLPPAAPQPPQVPSPVASPPPPPPPPAQTPPPVPAAIASPTSVISPSAFFRPQGAPQVAVAPVASTTRASAASLSQYPVTTDKPRADLTSVGELQVHEDGRHPRLVSAVKRTAHVMMGADGVLEGLPDEWQGELRKVFGLPLQLSVTMHIPGYAARLPPVLVLMKRYLVKNGGLLQRGIFRLAPEGNEASLVKAQLNEGTFTGCSDVNVIANLLKVWFRDMPLRLLDTVRDMTVFTTCETAEQAGKLVMTQFRDPHLTLMLWLLDLCADVCDRVDVNMMGPQNMAIVFAPNLFKLADGGVASGMDPIKLMSLCKKYTVFIEKAVEWRMSCVDRPRNE